MPNWILAAKVEDVPQGTGKELIVGDEIVALFHSDEGFYAIDGICPHHGGPLGSGSLEGCQISCPWHGWTFDVRDGTYQSNSELKHPTYATKVEDGEVWIDIGKNS